MKKVSMLFLRFIFAFGLMYAGSIFIDYFGMVIYALSVLIFSAPIILNNAARYSLKKEIKLIELEKSKIFYRFFSGKTFGYIIIITLGLFFAFVIPVRIYLFSSSTILSAKSFAVLLFFGTLLNVGSSSEAQISSVSSTSSMAL